MVIVLVGPDSYRRGKRLATLQEAFQQKFDTGGLSVTRLEGAQTTADDFQRATASAGLFSTKRFAVLSDLFAVPADAQDTIATLLPSVNDDTICVMTADSWPQKKSELKTWLQQNAKVEEFKTLNIPEAQQLVTHEVARAGATIEPLAAHTLAQRLSDDSWQLVLTAKSLAFESLNSPNKTVTTTQVERALGQAEEENFFALTDAVGAKQLQRSLELLQKHINEGAVAPMLISVLAKHITTLRLVQIAAPHQEIEGIHPYVVKKARQQAAKFSAEQLATAHNALLKLDSDMKTGNAPDPPSSLALIVSDLCA